MCSGGEGGIRTHGTVSRSQHFQCCQFNHSCTSPLPISDFQLHGRNPDRSEIYNWQSLMIWRRGWDSNPRWALTHSGFRDRCTNPLCDLSASLFRSLPEKFLHQRAALSFQHARELISNPVIQKIRVADAKATRNCSRAFIRRAVNQTPHSRLYQSSRAHRARLNRRINIHAGEPVIPELTGGFAKSNDFSVGCGIAVGARAVSANSDEFVFANDAGADGHFAIACASRAAASACRIHCSSNSDSAALNERPL